MADLEREIMDNMNSAMTAIKSGDKGMASILADMKSDTETTAAIAEYVESNPNLKQAAFKQAMSSSNNVTSMRSKENLAAAKNMKEFVKMTTPSRTELTGVKITQSQMVKRAVIKPNFPENTNYLAGSVIQLGNGLLMYYETNSTRRNNRASKLAGRDVTGEVIVIRRNERGLIESLKASEL